MVTLRSPRTTVRRHARSGVAMALAWLLLVVGMTFGSVATDRGPAAEAAPTLPAGFARTFYGTQMFAFQLAGLSFIPGQDRMFLTGKCGSLRRLDVDGTLLVMPSIPGVNCQTDRGLLGLDPAPDYATSGRVYTLYNYNGAKPNGDPAVMARLSRWTVERHRQPDEAPERGRAHQRPAGVLHDRCDL